jgi:hypothetical protein
MKKLFLFSVLATLLAGCVAVPVADYDGRGYHRDGYYSRSYSYYGPRYYTYDGPRYGYDNRWGYDNRSDYYGTNRHSGSY